MLVFLTHPKMLSIKICKEQERFRKKHFEQLSTVLGRFYKELFKVNWNNPVVMKQMWE